MLTAAFHPRCILAPPVRLTLHKQIEKLNTGSKVLETESRCLFVLIPTAEHPPLLLYLKSFFPRKNLQKSPSLFGWRQREEQNSGVVRVEGSRWFTYSLPLPVPVSLLLAVVLKKASREDSTEGRKERGKISLRPEGSFQEFSYLKLEVVGLWDLWETSRRWRT